MGAEKARFTRVMLREVRHGSKVGRLVLRTETLS